MADPFRNELEAAHAKLQRQEEKIAELEAEKEELKRARPRSSNATILVTLAGVTVALAVMGLGAVMFTVRRTAAAPPPPPTGLIGIPTAVAPEPPDVPSGMIPEPPSPTFNRGAAATALGSVKLSPCYTDQREFSYHVSVTYNPDGVPAVIVFDPTTLTPKEQACVRNEITIQGAIPKFVGAPVRVGKTYSHPAPKPSNDPGY